MAEISAQAVKALRERTGAGMMDCKKALEDAGGDTEKAVELLRERGLAKAARREGRTTSEGTIGLALTDEAAALVELTCETDFVAKTEEFQELARKLAEAVARDPAIDSPEKLLAARIGESTGRDLIQAAIARLGENVVVKRVARLALDAPGRLGGYVHAGGKLGVVVALATERTGPEVETLARDLAMHVAAADPTPLAVDRESLPEEVVAREREFRLREARASGKPESVVEKMVEGRLRKFFQEVALLDQPFVKDPDRRVGQVVAEVAGRVGGEIEVAGFVRYRLGEAEGP